MTSINMSPSVSVALRRIGATHLKLTAAMRPYFSLILFYWFAAPPPLEDGFCVHFEFLLVCLPIFVNNNNKY